MNVVMTQEEMTASAGASNEIMRYLTRLFPSPYFIRLADCERALATTNGDVTVDRFDGLGPTLEYATGDLKGRLSKYIAMNIEHFQPDKFRLVLGRRPQAILFAPGCWQITVRLCLMWDDPPRKADHFGLAVNADLLSRPWRDV